jgi:hypothetical protein
MPPGGDLDIGCWLVAGIGLLGAALVFGTMRWPAVLNVTGAGSAEFLKPAVAAMAGIEVTALNKRHLRDKPLTRSLLQAQVLLCVAGATVMILIGNSVARAFGVAGAAGIVRFRTSGEDRKDTTIVFLLVTLGFACGVGLLGVAGLGTVLLCAVLVVLDRFGETGSRNLILSVVASGKDFPEEHAHRILASDVNRYEVREVLRGSEATVRYTVSLAGAAPLSWVSKQLMAEGSSGLKSVSRQELGKKAT